MIMEVSLDTIISTHFKFPMDNCLFYFSNIRGLKASSQ